MTEQHDRDELVELMSRYANMPDTGNWDELSRSVFCDEFTADFSSIGAPVTTFSRDAWRQQKKQVFAAWTATHHAITNHRIAIDGDRATIRAHIRAEHWAPPEVAGRRTELLAGRRLLRRRRRANSRGLAPELGQADPDLPGERGAARGLDGGGERTDIAAVRCTPKIGTCCNFGRGPVASPPAEPRRGRRRWNSGSSTACTCLTR
jgi:SnoaL-like domain